MGKYRMREPWGYQDESGYQGSKVRFDNVLDSFFADADYDSGSSIVQFYNKDGEKVAEVDLSDLKTQDLIESAKYDNGYIVLTFSNGDVVKIDVQELLDENEFADGLQVNDGVVSVLIDPASDEYLTVSEEGIKLSGISDGIKDETDRATSAETALQEAIEAEVERATSAETSLREALDKEISDRDSVDQDIWKAIENETNDRTKTDTDLWGGINGETARAQEVEGQLWNAVNGETSRAQDVEKQLWDAVNGETTRAQDVEGQLWTALNNESERAKDAEDNLQAAIDAEVNRASSVEADLWTAVNNESSRAQGVESDLWTAVNGETTRAQDVEKQLWDAVNGEATRAQDVEGQLWDAVNGETTRAQDVEGQLWTALNQEIEDRKTAVEDEETRATAAEGELKAAIDAEVTRATSAEQDLQTQLGGGFDIRNTVEDNIDRIDSTIEALSANTEARLKDVNASDTSVSVDKTNPTIPSVKVNLSSEVENGKSNIIKLNADGLFASADLTYNTLTNTLTFTNTQGSVDIPLVSNSIIDRVYYDVSKEAIIIEYTVNGKRMNDIEVPVGDLISEWKVSSSHDGAIRLMKERNAAGSEITEDILSAEVVVSDHDDNILVNDNGSLYVSGAQIEANKKAIEDEAARAKGVEEGLQSQIDDLTTSSGDANESLKSLIEAETARATSKENELDGKINGANDLITALNTALEAEKNRASGAESAIDGKLDAEITRSTNKDNELETAIKNNTITFSGTNSVSFTTASNDTGDGKIVKADVKIANSTNNILSASDGLQGLFASVDLTYSTATNALTFSWSDVNGQMNSKLISLDGISIFKSMVYDHDKKALVLEYEVINESKEEIHTVEIDMVGLFNNYEVKNPTTNSAVLLEMKGDTGSTNYEISARLNVSEKEENIAKIVDNRLYVDGRADNIKYENASVSNLGNVRKALDKLFTDLAKANGDLTALNGELDKKADKEHEHTVADIKDVAIDAHGIVMSNLKVNDTINLEAGQF